MDSKEKFGKNTQNVNNYFDNLTINLFIRMEERTKLSAVDQLRKVRNWIFQQLRRRIKFNQLPGTHHGHSIRVHDRFQSVSYEEKQIIGKVSYSSTLRTLTYGQHCGMTECRTYCFLD